MCADGQRHSESHANARWRETTQMSSLLQGTEMLKCKSLYSIRETSFIPLFYGYFWPEISLVARLKSAHSNAHWREALPLQLLLKSRESKSIFSFLFFPLTFMFLILEDFPTNRWYASSRDNCPISVKSDSSAAFASKYNFKCRFFVTLL